LFSFPEAVAGTRVPALVERPARHARSWRTGHAVAGTRVPALVERSTWPISPASSTGPLPGRESRPSLSALAALGLWAAAGSSVAGTRVPALVERLAVGSA